MILEIFWAADRKTAIRDQVHWREARQRNIRED